MTKFKKFSELEDKLRKMPGYKERAIAASKQLDEDIAEYRNKILQYAIRNVRRRLETAGISLFAEDICSILFMVEKDREELWGSEGLLLGITYTRTSEGIRSKELYEYFSSSARFAKVEDEELRKNLDLLIHKSVVLSLNRDFLSPEKIDPAQWYEEKWRYSFSEYINRCVLDHGAVGNAEVGERLL